MTRQDQLNRAENILGEAAEAIGDALSALKILMRNDTSDRVFSQAADALKDAQDHLEDAISGVVDGFGIGAGND